MIHLFSFLVPDYIRNLHHTLKAVKQIHRWIPPASIDITAVVFPRTGTVIVRLSTDLVCEPLTIGPNSPLGEHLDETLRRLAKAVRLRDAEIRRKQGREWDREATPDGSPLGRAESEFLEVVEKVRRRHGVRTR